MAVLINFIMEVKSYQQGAGTKNSIRSQMGHWDIKTNIKKPHRQFVIDRVAESEASGKWVKGNYWIFQKFTRKGKSKRNWSYESAHMQKVKDALWRYPKTPTGQKTRAKKYLGYSKSGNAQARIDSGIKIKLNDIKSWALDTGRKYLFKGLSDEVMNFQDSYHN